MINFLSKFSYLLKGKHKTLLGMVLLFLFVSFLEVLGIGMVGPFISIATKPDSINQSYWLQWIYTQSHSNSANQFLAVLGIVVICIFYIKSFLSFYAQKTIFKFGFTQQGEISNRLMRAYLAAPYTFHLSRNSATLIRSIIEESYVFSNGVMMPLLTSIANGIVVVALALLLAQTSGMATVIIGGIFLIAFGLFQSFKDKIARWGSQGNQAMIEMTRIINHGMGGIKETRVIGCEAYFENQLRDQTNKYATGATLGLSFMNLPRYTIEAFLITFLIAFTFLFNTTNQDGNQNLSSVLGIFALASIRLLPATSNITSSINGIRYNTYAIDKIYSDLKEIESAKDFDPVRVENLLSSSLKNNGRVSFQDSVILEDISYIYPNSKKSSLEQISLTLEKGKSIGLIGRSGAGKTTLVDVILGLITPQSGDIKVDGISIYRDLRSWQNTIGYVPQSIFLIDDTLERNIAFGVPDDAIDSERMSAAIAAAQLWEVVEQLPEGLNTMVGERGVLLSGGQRQRVGIARALYHEREILVFDEATAALDNETEALVTEAIKSLGGVKTMIIIAHRLSTLEHCDRIYMLDKGEIVRSGSYQEIVLSK